MPMAKSGVDIAEGIGKPIIQQDPAVLRVECELHYRDTALQLDDLIQSPPPRHHSEKIDTWLHDSLCQWEICQDNHKSAGILKVHAYEVKITPIPNNPDPSSEKYSEIEDEDESSEKAEEQAKEDEDHTEGRDAEVVGSSFLSSAVPIAETSQPCSVTSFEHTKVVPFVDLRSKGSSLPKPTMEVPRPQPQMITWRCSVPPPAPSDTSSEVEGLTTIFKTGPPVLAKRSPDKLKKVVPFHTDNAALPAEVLKELNPTQLEEQETTSPMVVEHSIVMLPSVTPAEEVLPAFPIAEPMNVDDNDQPLSPPKDEAFMSLELTINPPAHIEASNSLDKIDYLTLPAIVARPSHLEKSLEDSPPAKNAPVNPKPASENPLKRRLQKLAQSILPTPAVCKHGPSPTEPPLVALGMGGGGFGEMPNESFKVLANGIAHIGVLEVEEDYGHFVRVDGHLWNKEVAVFIGEWSHYLYVSSFGPTLEVIAQKAESMISKIRQFLAGLDILEDTQVVQDQVASLCQSLQSSSAPKKNIKIDGAIAAGSFEEEAESSKD
ncbi:hypothetical protein IW261DRAFT_1423942 [Armillaria novae-zelandiae]|uniref:Uncharacterized protein n=1 Tax=Armillaria novae-zelandiae TaxID=153914 RepID=A0AA39T947_9AGAR|nr:hypothetical protein IW261DRAFT_1423942 [Armillaria novae-zelandiae]